MSNPGTPTFKNGMAYTFTPFTSPIESQLHVCEHVIFVVVGGIRNRDTMGPERECHYGQLNVYSASALHAFD